MEAISFIVTNGMVMGLLIIAYPLFLISNWILSNRINASPKRHALALGSTVVLTPVIYILLVMTLMIGDGYYKRTSFNQEDWLSQPDERFKMSKDIIDSRMLIGMEFEQVVGVLGEDFSIGSSEYTISYYIGFVPGMFRIDPDIIEIRFANGKVAEVKQRET